MTSVKDEEADRPGLKAANSQEAELVQRVIATPSFVRSALLTSFLLYICDRKFRGRDKEITEYQIGVQALGRPDSYNPGEDNIVRNYARILRKRLEEYFAGSGRDEPVRIVIPRGHYVPIFEPNTPTPSEFSGDVESQDASQLLLPIDPSYRTGKAAIWDAIRRFRIPVALMLAACIAVAIYWAVQTRPARINDVFWKEIFDGSRATYLVPGDSGFAMLQDITGREVHLNDYIAGNMEKRFPNFDLATAHAGGTFGPERFSNYTSTADLSIALSVASRAQFYGSPLKICYARDLRMEDLKRSNVILLGGPHANPWVELFEPESNFRMVFPMHLDGVHIDERSFVNKRPRTGEQPVYANLAGDTSHRTYTLVSFLPGADGAGHVLLLEGENMAGTQAAGDFLLDQRAMGPILNKARLSDGSIGPFEVLLEARTVGANAPEAHVVVERIGVTKTTE